MVSTKINLCLIGPDSIHLDRWADWFLKSKDYNVTLLKYPLYKNIFQYFCVILKLMKEYLKIRKVQDITHIHYIGPFAFFLVPLVKKNLILSAWGDDVLISPNKYKFWKILLKKCLKKAKIIITDADHVIKVLNEKYKISIEKTSLCLYGTNVNKYTPQNKLKLDIRKNYFGYENFVISSRNLEPNYNIETLIKSAKIVIDKNKYILFLIYGWGSKKEMLQELVKKLKLEKNVLLLGCYDSEEMQNILPNMDIYVSTSLSDAGLSASTAEAMASGIIPIITDFGDNSKWVIEGKTGYLFPLKDEKTLAKKILFVLENKDKLAKMRIAARAMIVNNLNYEKEMNKISSLYLELYRANKK